MIILHEYVIYIIKNKYLFIYIVYDLFGVITDLLDILTSFLNLCNAHILFIIYVNLKTLINQNII